MKNIRLLTKLLGGFITVSLIVLAVGLVGLIGARGLNASVVDLGRNRLTAVKSLDQIAIQQSRIESYEHSFMDKGLDQGAAQENFKKINDSRKAIDDSVKVYELLPKSKDEQDLWNQLKPALDSWWRADRDFITLVQAFQQSLQNAFSNSSDDSYAAMSNQIFENRTTFGTSNDILQKLLRVNDQQASMAVRHAAATGQLVELICAAGMGAGVLLALILGALLALSIARPLAKGVAFAEVVARGDFTRTLDLDRKDEVGKLAEALNTMAAKLGGVVATIQESAEQVASASQQITSSAVNLAEGAQSQASTLEETSASVEELTVSVDRVAEHAQFQASAVEQGSSSMAQVHRSIEEVSRSLGEIAGIAGQSVEKAVEGGRAVQQVVEGINLISASSEKIGGIVEVISDIADQTNLLALNASIEAARAGEHGRGFAVVADEVSKLADRSSASTKEIESLIKESVQNVSRGVETAKGSQAAMEEIRSASEKVKEMIAGLSDSMAQQVRAVQELAKALENVADMGRNISAAAAEQTSNARQVSHAVESVNDLTQAAASSAEEMSTSTEQLSRMAQELHGLVSQFRITAKGDGKANQIPLGNGDGKGTIGQMGRLLELATAE